MSTETRRLLGVHLFGTGATDLVHIGQAVMGCGGDVDYLVNTVFNYPTLSEAYKVAALDATNKMRVLSRFGASFAAPAPDGGTPDLPDVSDAASGGQPAEDVATV